MFGSLGFTEIFFIFIVALVIFGPRKLPEIGKTLGQALGQFKKASEDFKRSWETEVEVEKRRLMDDIETRQPEQARTIIPPVEPPAETQPATASATTPGSDPSLATLPGVDELEPAEPAATKEPAKEPADQTA